MTAVVDIVNQALQFIGTRTTITAAELANETSNEAIQANLVLYQLRDSLLRMAPWDCALNYNLLNYITSTPGTPENPSQQLAIWSKGQPPPPWAYEYQYPGDCIKACWIVPQFNTGYTSGVPITTAITGGSPSFWNGPPVKFKVGIDQFYSVTAAVPAAAGLGYAVGDLIVLTPGAYTPNNLPTANPPIGAPAILKVATIGGGGAVATVTIVNTLSQSEPENTEPQSGSYFLLPTNPVAQGSTTGAGAGATFTCTFSAQGDQRVILTNQEFALLAYVKQVTDPNVMDPSFLQAWVTILGARLVFALTGDKGLANLKVNECNALIAQARKDDANEGLTINDVTPDWIRFRGVDFPNWEFSPNNMAFDWGPMFTPF